MTTTFILQETDANAKDICEDEFLNKKFSIRTCISATTLKMSDEKMKAGIKIQNRRQSGCRAVLSKAEIDSLLQEASELKITLKVRVGNQAVEALAALQDAITAATQAAKDAKHSMDGNSKATDLAKSAKALQAAIAAARVLKAYDTAQKSLATAGTLGFYTEVKVDRDETKTSTQNESIMMKKSTIVATGGDVNLKADEKVGVIGSALESMNGDVVLNGKKGVDVTSAQEMSTLTKSIAHNRQSLAIGTRGLSASSGQDSSNTKASNTSQANSSVKAENGAFKVVTDGDFTLDGANGIAKDVDLTQVKGNTYLASRYDNYTSQTNGNHMETGNKMGYGVNYDSNTIQAVNNQTTLIGTHSVRTGGGILTIDGAILANAQFTIVTGINKQPDQIVWTDKGNMTIGNSNIVIKDKDGKEEYISDGYGFGGSNEAVQVNFGADKYKSKSTIYGVLGGYKLVNSDQMVAGNHSLNESQSSTVLEDSKGKV